MNFCFQVRVKFTEYIGSLCGDKLVWTSYSQSKFNVNVNKFYMAGTAKFIIFRVFNLEESIYKIQIIFKNNLKKFFRSMFSI